MRLIIAGTHLAFPKFVYVKIIFLAVMPTSSLLLKRVDNILPCEYSILFSYIRLCVFYESIGYITKLKWDCRMRIPKLIIVSFTFTRVIILCSTISCIFVLCQGNNRILYTVIQIRGLCIKVIRVLNAKEMNEQRGLGNLRVLTLS